MDNILSLLDKLRSIAIEGLTYGKDNYDKDRYQKILDLTSNKYSDITKISPEEIQRAFKEDKGCMTPKIGVDIAVINDKKQFLILKRNDDQRWCLPGGWVDVGEKPFETAIRETKEEAGIDIKPVGYIAITTKGPDSYPGLFHQLNILVVTENVSKDTQIKISHEHLDYKWADTSENVVWHAGHEKLPRYIQNYLDTKILLK